MENKMENKILQSSEYVVNNSDDVHINLIKLIDLSKVFESQKESNWLQNSPFDIDSLDVEDKLMFCVVFNAISFSYWGDPYWNVEYKGVLHTRGSWSLVASIFRSKDEGKSLLEPNFLYKLDLYKIKHVLRGNTQIPLIEERLSILNKIGAVIVNDFGGKFSNFMKSFGQDATSLQEAIVELFYPVFNDTYIYKGEKIFFNKRAQALVESIHSVFNGQSYGSINNINSLTALADYIIPNLLRSLGILEYSERLIRIIDSQTLIDKGSNFEIEIRAATVWVVELIRRKLLEKDIFTDAKSINDYLWSIGRDIETPFHLTRTIAY